MPDSLPVDSPSTTESIHIFSVIVPLPINVPLSIVLSPGDTFTKEHVPIFEIVIYLVKRIFLLARKCNLLDFLRRMSQIVLVDPDSFEERTICT